MLATFAVNMSCRLSANRATFSINGIVVPSKIELMLRSLAIHTPGQRRAISGGLGEAAVRARPAARRITVFAKFSRQCTNADLQEPGRLFPVPLAAGEC